MNGYRTQPISDSFERVIQDRLKFLREYLAALRKRNTNSARDFELLGTTEGNIAALEWVLREAKNG